MTCAVSNSHRPPRVGHRDQRESATHCLLSAVSLARHLGAQQAFPGVLIWGKEGTCVRLSSDEAVSEAPLRPKRTPFVVISLLLSFSSLGRTTGIPQSGRNAGLASRCTATTHCAAPRRGRTHAREQSTPFQRRP